MQTIIVDMTPGFRMPTIYYSQGDVGTQFAIDLRSRFGDTLPESATVTIQATKPSGFGFSVAATSVTNGVATFTTTAEMTDEFGRFPAELKVTKTGLTLFTANFYMDGEINTHPEGTIDGQQETVIPELAQLVERVEDAASSVLDMNVVANTLPAGSDATYSYDEETNTATFGIPKGADGSLASGVLAPTYSSSSTYAVGDYVYYSGNLYRCTTAITTAEAWTSGHWTQVALAPEVSDLKSEFTDLAKSEDIHRLAYENNGKMIDSSNAEVSNTVLSHTDYIKIPDDAIAIECGNRVVSGGNTFRINPNVLFYDENKGFLAGRKNTTDDIATYSFIGKAKYVKVNQPAKNATGDSLIRWVFDNRNGYVGEATVTFTSTASAKNTLMYLRAGVAYSIICKTEINGKINAYVASDTSRLVRFFSKRAIDFTPSQDGWLTVYNANGTVTGDVVFEVYESSKMLAKMRRTPSIYEVGAEKKYTSLTALLLALKNDDSEKTIYVDGGDYDIFQEYSDLGLLDGDAPSNPQTAYFDYNVWIPSNTHIIGRGIVRLLWQPSASDISTGWSKTISPVNAAGSMILENVEIHCKNGRYCIHDDPLGKAQFVGARKIYKNVKCYKYNNDEGYGFASVIGFGIDRKMQYEFDNCYFYSEANNTTFYMHNRASDELGAIAKTNSSNVVVKNSVIDTVGNGIGVKLGNVNSSSALRIRVNFDSCYIGGWLLISDESDNATGNNANTFDVTLCRCNEARILVRDTNNQYPVKQY